MDYDSLRGADLDRAIAEIEAARDLPKPEWRPTRTYDIESPEGRTPYVQFTMYKSNEGNVGWARSGRRDHDPLIVNTGKRELTFSEIGEVLMQIARVQEPNPNAFAVKNASLINIIGIDIKEPKPR